MQKMMRYKGYRGTVDYSSVNQVYYGKVLDVNSLLSYEGQTTTDLEHDFHGVIDDYLAECAVLGMTPEK